MPAERDALIGGDWYDAFELPDGRLIFSIGDVAGHGLAASLSVGRLRQAIYALAFTLHDPATILAQLNAMLEHQEPGTMVTAMVGAIDPDHARLTYASAGHPPPIVAYPGDETARSLPLGGPPLGTGLAARWTLHRARLAPDAVLAVFTDGMIEFSRDVADAEARLRAAVKLLVGDTTIARPAAAVQQLVFDTRRPHDDAALLIVQFSDVDAGALDYDAAALTHTWRFHSSDAYTAHTSRREIVRFIRSLAIEHDQLFACELIRGEYPRQHRRTRARPRRGATRLDARETGRDRPRHGPRSRAIRRTAARRCPQRGRPWHLSRQRTRRRGDRETSGRLWDRDPGRAADRGQARTARARRARLAGGVLAARAAQDFVGALCEVAANPEDRVFARGNAAREGMRGVAARACNSSSPVHAAIARASAW